MQMMKWCMHIHSIAFSERPTVVMTDHHHLLNILPTAVRHFYSQRMSRSDVPTFARSSLMYVHATPARTRTTHRYCVCSKICDGVCDGTIVLSRAASTVDKQQMDSCWLTTAVTCYTGSCCRPHGRHHQSPNGPALLLHRLVKSTNTRVNPANAMLVPSPQ